jgi:single-strand DNA-binding protein
MSSLKSVLASTAGVATFAVKQKVEWHNISVFGKLAELVSNYCFKGSKVYVEGKLQTDQYEKNGETRYSTKIVVNGIGPISMESKNSCKVLVSNAEDTTRMVCHH